MVLWFGLQCVVVVFPYHTYLLFYTHFFKNLHKSWIGVIVLFLEHTKHIDQHSLVSCGWPRDDGNIYSTHPRN